MFLYSKFRILECQKIEFCPPYFGYSNIYEIKIQKFQDMFEDDMI